MHRKATPPAASHGPYRLMTFNGSFTVMRRDPDHSRTVAIIDDRSQWDRFVAALEAGANEVAAVRAIDETGPIA